MKSNAEALAVPVERTRAIDYVALARRYAAHYSLGSPHLMGRLATAADLVPAYARPEAPAPELAPAAPRR